MVDLDRLLNRLQQTILRADADRERRLRNSEYERQKLAFNIDYARTLLTKMDQDAFSIKVLTRKQETQDDLKRKREVLDHITHRLKDLEEMSTHVDDDDTGSEADDILHEIIMTPSESMDSRSTDVATQVTGDGDEYEDEQAARSPVQRENTVETLNEVLSEKPDVITAHDLRSRGKQTAPSDQEKKPQDLDTAQTTGATRSLLFGNRSTEVSDISTTEAILDHQRQEQEVVTEDLLRMASQLKLSSQKFGEALQEDTEILTRAGEGLNKNELSLEAAARRMGAITKMTEGKGWWGRIMLYAWIYGLMVVMILVVFVLPKLRF
ncbi:hypothetical protein M406DRAFT_86758 [Cryphonectria parasitica EP155]|uniref:Synaptobrevin n=1 Tax=Cryphonectria parasitica (strain ATCC 38755 / EP155) TaxID=660469 RepID=A0A9P5CTR0_CRYP1|nr:uncharacterized protein M406DRAFT_86758 [Cryphonectria parasitica EP155]KAF3769952.1 hypothetical protein M406DRAFT_86758 [Cryphonectria parasitica EP155]